jgi:hypothetical protein
MRYVLCIGLLGLTGCVVETPARTTATYVTPAPTTTYVAPAPSVAYPTATYVVPPRTVYRSPY